MPVPRRYLQARAEARPVMAIQSPFWLPSEGVTPVTTKLHDAVSSTQVLPQQVPPSQTFAAGAAVVRVARGVDAGGAAVPLAARAHAGVAARVEGRVACRAGVERGVGPAWSCRTLRTRTPRPPRTRPPTPPGPSDSHARMMSHPGALANVEMAVATPAPPPWSFRRASAVTKSSGCSARGEWAACCWGETAASRPRGGAEGAAGRPRLNACARRTQLRGADASGSASGRRPAVAPGDGDAARHGRGRRGGSLSRLRAHRNGPTLRERIAGGGRSPRRRWRAWRARWGPPSRTRTRRASSTAT